jgi:hypothetical protein
MRDSILFAGPFLIAAIVLAVRFVGCSFHAGSQAPTPYSTEIMNTPGLVSFWRLNETSGTAANDSTDGNAGTYENGVTLGVPSQVYTDTDNTAAQFDGVSQFVTVPFAANINTATFTVEAIVNPSAIGPAGPGEFHMVAFSRIIDANNAFGYSLTLHGSAFEGRVGSGSGTAQSEVAVPADAAADAGPYYLAMTYDGTALTLYVNPADPFDPANPGETVQQQATANVAFAPNPASDLAIGASNLGAGEAFFFPGVINDVAIYNVALDFPTIQSHYMVMMTGYSM